MSDVQPIPEGCHTLTPHLVVKNAAKAIEFYQQAFGAEELISMPSPDGKLIMYAELKIGDSRLMLNDEMPGPQQCMAPQTLNGTPVTLHIWSEDADAAFDRAVKAGATVSMPLMDAFWGDRYGRLTDPFGHQWSISTHQRDLTPEEIAQAGEEFFAQMGD